MSPTSLGWFFTLGVLAHNAEEALWLPAWSLRAGRLYKPVSPLVFRFATVLISVIFIAITAGASFSPPASFGADLMAGYVLAMVLNVCAPHVAAAVFMRRYMPGTATAMLLNLPLGLLYLRRAIVTHAIECSVFCWAGPLVVAAIVALLPVLFTLGRKLYPSAL